MTDIDLEKLAFELHKMGPMERAKHVAKMVIEARIEQLEWVKTFIKSRPIESLDLINEIAKLKEEK